MNLLLLDVGFGSGPAISPMPPNNRAVSHEHQLTVANPAAIVAQGIAKDPLTSAGYGPDKPVRDNATAEGRTQKRRVELVKS